MTLTEFVALVAGMRQAQREYFRTRDSKALDYARNLERQVDKAVKEMAEPQTKLPFA